MASTEVGGEGEDEGEVEDKNGSVPGSGAVAGEGAGSLRLSAIERIRRTREELNARNRASGGGRVRGEAKAAHGSDSDSDSDSEFEPMEGSTRLPGMAGASMDRASVSSSGRESMLLSSSMVGGPESGASHDGANADSHVGKKRASPDGA